jgi:hypothetical protein
MGAANCCKKPDEIVIDEIKNNKEEDKLNTQEQEDSYPQDTVHKTNNNQEEEINNQQLYEQDGTQKIGEPYEVPINVSSPIQNKQMEEYEQNYIQAAEYEIQDPQMQTEAVNINQYTQEEMPNMNLSSQIRISGDSETENMNSLRIRNQPEIQHSGIGEIDKAALISQQSAAPTNNLVNQIITSQQVAPTPISSHTQELNIKTNIVKQQPPLAQKEEEEENINKYFQIPPGQYTNIDDYDNMMQQNQIQAQSQKQEIKVASVTPIEENDDLNQYFINQPPVSPVEQTNDLDDKELHNEYYTTAITHDIKPEELTENNLNEIVNMKNLPETFGSSNIQQISIQHQPQINTTTTVTKTTENIPINDTNNFKQTTTTTKTETIGNIPTTLTNSEIKKIVDMKDLPETIGSSTINNFQKKTITTTTHTTGNVDLTNIPTGLTSSTIQKIIDMKDLPAAFGSSDIKNFKQTTTTTKTETRGNIPTTLTNSEINKILNMKDLPETIGSNTMKKTTVTTTTTTNQPKIDLSQFGLEQNPSISQLKSPPIDLKQFGLAPTSSAVSTNQSKKVTTVTKTVQKKGVIPSQNYSNYFQQHTQVASSPVDLKQFGLEKNASNISNILQGSNITFKQPEQSLKIPNYIQIKNITPAASTPIIPSNNINSYYKTSKTTTTTVKPSYGVISSGVNPNIN